MPGVILAVTPERETSSAMSFNKVVRSVVFSAREEGSWSNPRDACWAMKAGSKPDRLRAIVPGLAMRSRLWAAGPGALH
jgi:hypothetical protein